MSTTRKHAVAVIVEIRDEMRRKRMPGAEQRTAIACLTGLLAGISLLTPHPSSSEADAIESLFNEWLRPDFVRLKAGEMSSNEMKRVLETVAMARDRFMIGVTPDLVKVSSM